MGIHLWGSLSPFWTRPEPKWQSQAPHATVIKTRMLSPASKEFRRSTCNLQLCISNFKFRFWHWYMTLAGAHKKTSRQHGECLTYSLQILTLQTARSARAPSLEVGESCPPNALRPLPRPPTSASQYLWQNWKIQWLLLPSSLPSRTISYHDCRVLMQSAEYKIVHVRCGVNLNQTRFWEKRFRWHHPSLGWRDRDGGEQTTDLDKTESPWEYLCVGCFLI